MEFVTLHELSKEFDLPARVVRYRFHQLRQARKLNEGDDWRRDDYVDDQHFVWKINPLSFMRETGLAPAAQRNSGIPYPEPVTKNANAVNEPVNESDARVNSIVNEPEPLATEPHRAGNHNDNNLEFSEESRRFEHEIIDFLKEQIRSKDGQLREQGEQLRELNNSNVRFMGAMLQQAQKIEDLLRLTSGPRPLDTKIGNGTHAAVNNAVNQKGGPDSEAVNQLDHNN